MHETGERGVNRRRYPCEPSKTTDMHVAPTSVAERRCHMARLRTMLLTLAVAALLLVGTASTALAGLTATAAD
jgi:hypothetical protein